MPYKKRYTDESVLDAGRRRMAWVYASFDYVSVSFSGGKDSTACLQLALEAATAAGRLPVEVVFWDEEAIHPETIAYVERVRQWPTVRLRWLCVPIRHRNACSRAHPWWHCWDPAEQAKWVRPMPAGAETTLPGFVHGMSMPEAAPLLHGPELGTVCHVLGIRAAESLRRARTVLLKLEDNWLCPGERHHLTRAYPVYDWTTLDVWTAPQRFGWDYNRAYDLMALTGLSAHAQRVCPPYGEEPLGGLWMYAVCWPDLWHRMLARVPGAATAGRYGNTELYGFGGLKLPTGHTWRSYTYALMDLYHPDERRAVARSLAWLLGYHRRVTAGRPVPDGAMDPDSGVSWRDLALIVHRGDLKMRRAQNVSSKGIALRAKRERVAAAAATDAEAAAAAALLTPGDESEEGTRF